MNVPKKGDLTMRMTVASMALCTALLAGCGGGGDGGGSGAPAPSPTPVPTAVPLPDPASAPSMKTVFGGNFMVGAAIPPEYTLGSNGALLLKHFNSLTAENAMKPDTLQPSRAGSPDEPA